MLVDEPDRPAAGDEPRTSGHSGRSCPACGAAVEGRLDRKWCSEACRKRIARQRKARELAGLLEQLRGLIGG